MVGICGHRPWSERVICLAGGLWCSQTLPADMQAFFQEAGIQTLPAAALTTFCRIASG
jgi:hypothetical protein